MEKLRKFKKIKENGKYRDLQETYFQMFEMRRRGARQALYTH